MKNMKIHKLSVICAALFICSNAQATNGYFLPGSGFRAQGMGGVGIAYGRDSLSANANPANIVNTGMRGDLGFGIFNPERFAATGTPAGQASPFGFDRAVESDSRYFIIPEMGFTMPLDDRLHVGLAVVGNGGMNTTYPQNFFSFTGTPPVDSKIGVDMMQLLVPVSVAYKVNENHALGASLVLAETRFRAYGLEAFPLFDAGMTITADPGHLTGQGFDYSYGAGLKFGWQGEFLEDKVTLGLVYTSRTYMTKFDKYRGLFAEQGDFDIPENYGIGIALKPVKGLVIAADVLRINYSDVASIGNRGPGTAIIPYNNTNAAQAIPSVTDASKELGNDDGMGFGWKDQTVYKLGVQYGVNNRLQVRAGYNYGRSPIPNDQLTFNTLAPATVERHYSLGFTYKANENLEITGMYMYVAPHNQDSPRRQNIVGEVEIGMHQNVWGLSFGWVLDPSQKDAEEYGDGDWAGINFDGWYAGLGIGQSNYTDVDQTSANTRTEGWKVYAGYQFNKYLGVEGGYVNLNDMTGTKGAVRTEIDTDAWALSAVLSYPITDKISLMGKAGMAYMLADVQTKNGSAATVTTGKDGYEPTYGVGVKYAVFDNLDLRAEWDRYDRNDMNIDLISAGMAVKF